MPRFHFHVHDGTDFPDQEGTELPDLQAAQREAIRLAAGCLSEAPDHFWNEHAWSVDVTDHQQVGLFTLTFTAKLADALSPDQEIVTD